MKTRITSRVVALCLFFLAASVGLNGCLQEPVSPTVGEAKFGSIRIMNFADCSNPFDVFIYIQDSKDTVITRAVAYGVGSAYATNLSPGIYKVQLTNLNNRDIILAQADVVIAANDAKSVMVFGDNQTKDIIVSPDQKVDSYDPSKVYVRFLNTKSTPDKVRLVIDNPLNAPIAEFANVQSKVTTKYVALDHALDTSYALYLVNPDNNTQVISRLAGAAFGPGQFYTVVYSGNLDQCRDTTAEKADTLRLRYFDDNQQGNDLTFPVQQTLRFNIVNGLIPPPVLHQPEQRTYKTAGVVINNDDRFLVPQIAPKKVARTIREENGVIISGFYTTSWTEAIQFGMYANVYDGDNVIDGKRGIKLVDLRAGNRKEVKSDIPFSIIIMDTVRSDVTNGVTNVDSTKIISFSIPLPDVPTNEAQIVLVNALAPSPRLSPPNTSTFAKFYVNDVAPPVFSIAQAARKYTTVSQGAGNVTIKVDIGKPAVGSPIEKSFNAEAGGIYEVVLVGQRGNDTDEGRPEILIIHTNKTSN